MGISAETDAAALVLRKHVFLDSNQRVGTPVSRPRPFAAPRHFLIEVNARRAVILEGRS